MHLGAAHVSSIGKGFQPVSSWQVGDGGCLVRFEGRPAVLTELTDEVVKGLSLRRSSRDLELSLRVEGTFPDALTLEAGVEVRGNFLVAPPGADHLVVSGRVHALSEPSKTRVQQLVADFQLSIGSALSPKKYFALLADPDASSHLHYSSVTYAWDEQLTAVLPPDGLKAILYPYQLEGYARLKTLSNRDLGSMLCDEMGLGKTIQIISLLISQRTNGRSIVIVPASLISNWIRELGEFAPDLVTAVHFGPTRAGAISSLPAVDVLLTTYETLVSDSPFMSQVEWNIIVLDEAQKIKNPDATRTRSVKQLSGRVRICVTGTPVENRLADLWSLSEFVLPGLLGHLREFNDSYPDEEASATALGVVVAPIRIRRKVSEVADDLPALLQIPVAIGPSPLLLARLDEVKRQRPGFAGVTEQRVLAAHADSDGDEPLQNTPKGEVVLDMLREVFANNQKALVFAPFQETVDRIAGSLSEMAPLAFVGVVDGRLPPALRQTLIDEFSSHAGFGALVLNPQAAGVGLNITAASHVMHFSPEWNPAVTAQATARAYRRKQTKTVVVHHFYYEGTIEEAAVTRAEFKKQLAGAVDYGQKLADDLGDDQVS